MKKTVLVSILILAVLAFLPHKGRTEEIPKPLMKHGLATGEAFKPDRKSVV